MPFDFDPLYNPYASRRVPVYAKNGLVATSQPLATQVGLRTLQLGGNAIDAAVATAAALTVVEPTANGIGGDAFALVWAGGKLHGLNASGPAPGLLSFETLIRAGVREIPKTGLIPVTVPGAPAAWAELSTKFGRLPFSTLFEPAIDYAEQGYPVSPVVSRSWQQAVRQYDGHLGCAEFKGWFDTFAPQGRAPQPGEMWRSSAHADTLRQIAETNAEAFYRGSLAERIHAFFETHGGYLRQGDLAAFQPEWVTPVGINYRGYDIWEIPPNGHGLVALMALNILKGLDFTERDTVDTYHKQIESIKLAYADGFRYIADPAHMTVKVSDLLSEGYAAERRRLIGAGAILPEPGMPPRGGTVYLCTADREGNMVSYIQSNFNGFGSGLVVPDTGIALHNRGCGFSMNPDHDNCVQPGKRPYHTIIPGFITRDNQPVGPFGVMGGFMQPQGHVQVVMNTIDFGLNPQAALDAPRWQWVSGRQVEFEHSIPLHITQALIARGHEGKVAASAFPFGRGQVIWRRPDGVLVGATEPRADGQAAGW